MTSGKVKRVYLGLSGQTRIVSNKFLRFHNLKNNQLFEIVQVEDESLQRERICMPVIL